MILYLCEKPSQARDIAKILGVTRKTEHCLEGQDITVTWCYGHLLETVPPEAYDARFKGWRLSDLPIVPDIWQVAPVVKAKRQLVAIKNLLKKTRVVVIATDADREGELIGREVLDFCKYKGEIKRLWLSALDDASIKKALKEVRPGESTQALYAAGLGRQRADWLVGINLTRAATCAFSKERGKVLSVGRVQTPTLNLIVKRDETIANFKPVDYFVLQVSFLSKEQTFWAKWEASDDALDENGYCTNKLLVEEIAQKVNGQTGKVIEFQNKPAKQSAPLCLSLSSLQKIASSKHGFSAKKTLEIAQSLYETHKATSYPRTDCGYLPTSQFSDAATIFSLLKKVNGQWVSLIDECDLKFKSPAWNDTKVTAHHGIIPTRQANIQWERLSVDEQKLYDLIVRHYIAQFLGDYHYRSRKVTVSCCDEKFTARSNTPTRLGWKKALDKMDDKDEKKEGDEEVSHIPSLSVHEKVDYQDHRIDAKRTKPPAHFTEGTLIDAMKNIGKWVEEPEFKKILKNTAGIGTEATRATIIEVLLKREYIIRKGKLLLSTDKGKQLIATLPGKMTEPALTARWEQALDEVSTGQLTLETFLEQQTQHLRGLLQCIRPEPGANSKPAQSYAKESSFEAFTLKKSPEKPGASQTTNLKTPACPKCKKTLLKRNGQYGEFWGCSGFPACRVTLPIRTSSA